MPGKGKFSGFNWHHEFHTVDPKKEKAADCIFLTEQRICLNKACHLYGEKCFVAAHCKYRLKDGEAPVAPPQKDIEQPARSKKIVSINCTLPPNCTIYSKAFGQGHYVGFDKTNMIIAVEFESGIKHFNYPDAFFKKHLFTHKYGFSRICIDSKRAERE